MKFTYLLRIAGYNITRSKKQSLWTFINILIISTVMILWLICVFSFQNAMDWYDYGSASVNYQSFNILLDENKEIADTEEYAILMTAKDWEETEAPQFSSSIDLVSMSGHDDWYFVNAKYVSLTLDGKEYQGENDYTYYFERPFDEATPYYNYSVPFRMSILHEGRLFSDNDIKEFNYFFPGEKTFIAGTDNISDNGIILSDYILQRFDITDNYQELIGKKISFAIEGKPVLQEYVIEGIVNGNIFYNSALKASAQIYIKGTKKNYEICDISFITAKLPVKEFKYSKTVYNKLDEEGYSHSFFDAFLMEYYYNVNAIHQSVKRIIFIFEVLIFIAIGINLYSILLDSANRKCRFYGVNRAMGMSKADLCIISYCELVILAIPALILSFVVSIPVLSIADSIVYTLINTHLSILPLQYVAIASITILAVLCLFVIVEAAILPTFVKLAPAQLLKGLHKSD